MQPFRTHTGRLVTGAELQSALTKVAADWRALAHAIRADDNYAPHVTEARKEAALVEMLRRADAIEAGDFSTFTIWQRVNAAITGDCVAFLPA